MLKFSTNVRFLFFLRGVKDKWYYWLIWNFQYKNIPFYNVLKISNRISICFFSKKRLFLSAFKNNRTWCQCLHVYKVQVDFCLEVFLYQNTNPALAMQISASGQISVPWSFCFIVSEVVCAGMWYISSCSWLRCNHAPSVFANIRSLTPFLLECRDGKGWMDSGQGDFLLSL